MKKAKNNKLSKYLPKTKTEKILSIVFIIMLLLVIVLLCIAINKKKELAKKQNADIVIPVLEKSTNNTVNIDISNLKEKGLKDYSFRITNYKEKTMNKAVTAYNISFDTNENDVTLKLYKNGSEEDLFKDKTSYEIKSLSLKSKEKQEDVYTVIIKANKEIKNKQSIKVKITSENWQKKYANI